MCLLKLQAMISRFMLLPTIFLSTASHLPNSLSIDVSCRIRKVQFICTKAREVAEFLLSTSRVIGEHRTSDHSIHRSAATFQNYS